MARLAETFALPERELGSSTSVMCVGCEVGMYVLGLQGKL